MKVWEGHAKQWEYLGSPMKPSSTDTQISNLWVNEKAHASAKPLTVLLLGVTPELVNLHWPNNTKLLAVDLNLTMINEVLPKETPRLKPFAVAGNWLQLPLTTASIDIVIGDGCYSSLAENDYEKMTKEIRRVLTSTGTLIMRFFTRPTVHETIETIQDDFYSGKINSFHVLKWRLAMVLHGSLKQGVCVKTIWDIWNTQFKQNHEYKKQIEKLEWPEQVIKTIDTYKDTNIFYTFPSLQEVRHTFQQQFKEQDCYIPDYALGERCPTLKFCPL